MWFGRKKSVGIREITIDMDDEGEAADNLFEALLESVGQLSIENQVRVAGALGIEPSDLRRGTMGAIVRSTHEVLDYARTVAAITNAGFALASGVDRLARGEYLGAAADLAGGAGKTLRDVSAARAALGAAPETRAVGTTGKLARSPRHHVFPQEHRQWFSQRGFDIDKYTLELDEGTHSALHTMGWNDEIMRALKHREAVKGSRLTIDEILDIGKTQLQDYKIREYQFVPFRDP